MNTNEMPTKNKHLDILFSVLLFGGLWGVLEATLGTFLHLPLVDAAGMYACSTTIMVPIAFYLLAGCFKKSGSYRSMIYMGALAAAIKALSCLIFKMNYNPCYYILLESCVMAGAMLAIRPKKVISFAGLATMILASTSYLVIVELFKLPHLTWSAWSGDFEKRVFMFNAVAILYTFASGSIIYGAMKLAAKFNWNFDSIKKVIYHPATASVMTAAAIVLAVVLH